MLAIGLLLTLVMFATMRTMMSARRGSSAAGGAMLALGQIGIGLQVVALTMIGVLTLRPEDADPGSSRAILDLSELLAGISGAALALALIAMALGIRRTPGLLPARFSEAALLVAVGVALWTVRLFSDAGAFAADSFLGSTLGWTAPDRLGARGRRLAARDPARARAVLPAGRPRPAPAGVPSGRRGRATAAAPRPRRARSAPPSGCRRGPRRRTPPAHPRGAPRPRKPFVPPPIRRRADARRSPAPPDEPATASRSPSPASSPEPNRERHGSVRARGPSRRT